MSVIKLELGKLRLSGTISPSIARLSNLQTLSLEDNYLTGVIPPQLSKLRHLKTLDLSNNRLHGPVPDSFAQLSNLNTLLLNNNSLFGPIPASLLSIPSLRFLDVSFNNLSGRVPKVEITVFRAEGNQGLCGYGTDQDCPGQARSSANNASRGLKASHSSHYRRNLTIVGTLMGSILAILLLIGTWAWRRKREQVLREQHDSIDVEMCLGQLTRYSLQELRQATDSFSRKNLLGAGGSGQVYKGQLEDGSLVAVKRLRDRQEAPTQFMVEVKIIGSAVHRNLLRLLGCCITPTEHILVYPYMRNGSVASRLQGKPALDWHTRKQVAIGAARGLVYLHEQCDPKIIHGDVKAANILLDEDYEAIVADFGLAQFLDHSVSHVTTAVRGTIGYIAPESLSSGQFSAKTDVYSYGILLLELITGQTELGFRRISGQKLPDWVRRLHEENRLDELVDEEVTKSGYKMQELKEMVQVALLCTLSPYVDRPRMSEVLHMLEGSGLADTRWEEWQKAEMDRITTEDYDQATSESTCAGSDQSSFGLESQLSGPR